MIARDDHPTVVVQKSAQVGATELLVNLALWAVDTGYAGRGNTLFLMPTQNQMDDFASARFDRAIQDSAYLRERLQPEPPRRKGADSKRLKRIGPGYLYMRGADSRRQIASVDADLVILDEFDQMRDGTLELARKRLTSSAAGRLRIASTPRFPETGVNALFLQSDQRRYYLPCPACDLEQALTWEDNIDKERKLRVCRKCRAPMNLLLEGVWRPEAPGNTEIRGYHLSRLYSPWANLKEMIAASHRDTTAELQEFYNSDLGEVFSPPGGGLTLDELDRCRREYTLEEYAGQPCDMGVDVGLKLHVVIREHVHKVVEEPDLVYRGRSDRPPRLWFAGTVETFDDLDKLKRRFNVEYCVIDRLPETRLAEAFARRHGDVWCAYYGASPADHGSLDQQNGVRIIHLNRTMALDEMVARFRAGTAEVPGMARQLGGRVEGGVGEYYRELRAPQRTLEQDAHGNWVARWLEHGKADHFAHAEAYCCAADAHTVHRGLIVGRIRLH